MSYRTNRKLEDITIRVKRSERYRQVELDPTVIATSQDTTDTIMIDVDYIDAADQTIQLRRPGLDQLRLPAGATDLARKYARLLHVLQQPLHKMSNTELVTAADCFAYIISAMGLTNREGSVSRSVGVTISTMSIRPMDIALDTSELFKILSAPLDGMNLNIQVGDLNRVATSYGREGEMYYNHHIASVLGYIRSFKDVFLANGKLAVLHKFENPSHRHVVHFGSEYKDVFTTLYGIMRSLVEYFFVQGGWRMYKASRANDPWSRVLRKLDESYKHLCPSIAGRVVKGEELLLPGVKWCDPVVQLCRATSAMIVAMAYDMSLPEVE